MGYELDRLMQQFGVSTPTLTYSGMSMPIKPTDLSTAASSTDRANYDALLAKYNADMPLYTSDQAKFKTYSDDYNNRLATTSLYDAPQFQKLATSSPGTGMFTDQYSQMYQDVLKRAPDPSGLAYWRNKFGDMISPEEYSEFAQSADNELRSRPVNTLPAAGGQRAMLNQPTYNTPTAAPVLQTAATTAPVVLPVGDGSPAGGEKGAGNDGVGGGFPGSTMVGGISGPTTGLASFANSLAATLGNMSGGKGILGGISDAIARNVDPNFSHEGRAGRGSSADQANAALAAAESAAADTSGTGGFTSGANADGYGGGDLGAFLAKGGYIGRYAHGGAVRHYQAGGDVMSKMAEAEQLIKALESGKLTGYEREDAMSRVAEIYRMLDEEPAQAAPTPIPESLLAQQVAPAQTRSAMPEPAYIPDIAPSMDLIEPMPESIKLTPVEIRQAIADASPLTALKETVNNKPVAVEGAPLVRPLDPRLYGETNEVATGPGYSPMDPRLYGESDEVATGKGYSPMDPRLYGESDEVASGPGYSMPVTAQAAPPAVDRKLLDLAAKYTKPGFTPTFAQGSIDPGANRMALISQNAIANKIANPVINIQPEYSDDSANRLSMPMPQDTTIPMSPTMAMLQKMLLANQSQASPYADELRTARAAATAQTAAFNKMLENAIKGQDDNKPSKAEMYFRLAAAFGAPTKTGNFSESLAEVNKSMAEQAKETRLAGKAGQALKLQLGLEGAKVGMTAARDDVTALRALTGEEMKEKASAQRELIKEYFKSGEAQSTFGKQAQDEGLTPGTAKYQARVTALSDEALRRMTAGADAAAAAAQASLASIGRGDASTTLAREKFTASKIEKAEAAKKLSGPEIKMKEETSQALVTMRDAYADLVKALQLSANAYDGSFADQAIYKPLAAAGNQDPKVVNTGVLDNLLKLGALSTAATTLKTQISDSDMKMLNQVQGAGAKSRQERDAILKAAMVRMENMYQEKKSKLAEIVSGKYRIATPAIAEEAE